MDDVVKEATENLTAARQAMAYNHTHFKDDMRFLAGDQWPAGVMDLWGDRPALTINRLPQFVHQITNEQRQNRPAIKVSPVDDGADVATAKLLQGMVRGIEYASNADGAYDMGLDYAASGGFGYLRVDTAYEDAYTFNQVLRISACPNPLDVYLDPTATGLVAEDADWGVVLYTVPRATYLKQYKETDAVSFTGDISGLPTGAGETVTLAEYIYADETDTHLIMAKRPDGSVITFLESTRKPTGDMQILQKRRTTIRQFKRCILNGDEVLEETDWQSQYLPIVPVYGVRRLVDGEVRYESAIRHALDSQRMYNYWASAETESIALAPKAPFIGAMGQFEGFEAQWQQANRRPTPYLEYKPTTASGQLAPPPQRNAYAPPIGAISQARSHSAEDLKATTGIYDAALGSAGPERTGRAILARQQQSTTSNFHFADNLSRAITQVGKILVDMIPVIYDTERTVQIVGDDGTVASETVNAVLGDGKQAYMLGTGRYDVRVETGPSYATKRQESVAAMLELTQAYPRVAEISGDLIVKSMDWPMAQEIADRLKRTIPPEVVGESDDKDISPKAKTMLAQAQQAIQQLTEQLNAATDDLRTKRIETESREEIAAMKAKVDILTTLMSNDAQDSRHLLMAELKRLELGQGEKGQEGAPEAEEALAPMMQTQTPPNGIGDVQPTEDNPE